MPDKELSADDRRACGLRSRRRRRAALRRCCNDSRRQPVDAVAGACRHWRPALGVPIGPGGRRGWVFLTTRGQGRPPPQAQAVIEAANGVHRRGRRVASDPAAGRPSGWARSQRMAPYVLPTLLAGPGRPAARPAPVAGDRGSRPSGCSTGLREGSVDAALIASAGRQPAASPKSRSTTRISVRALPPGHSTGRQAASAARRAGRSRRLLLLDEGHCLASDQALDVCRKAGVHVELANTRRRRRWQRWLQCVTGGLGVMLIRRARRPSRLHQPVWSWRILRRTSSRTTHRPGLPVVQRPRGLYRQLAGFDRRPAAADKQVRPAGSERDVNVSSFADAGLHAGEHQRTRTSNGC